MGPTCKEEGYVAIVGQVNGVDQMASYFVVVFIERINNNTGACLVTVGTPETPLQARQRWAAITLARRPSTAGQEC